MGVAGKLEITIKISEFPDAETVDSYKFPVLAWCPYAEANWCPSGTRFINGELVIIRE